MKSAMLTGIKKVELFDLPVPVPKKPEVLVRIKSCSLCGSDVHYYKRGRIGDSFCKYPHAIGHEPSGVVEKSFKGGLFKEGDRVAVEPGLSCGSCEFCKAGRPNICPNVRFLASPGMPGAFQEYLALDESQLEKIPDSVSFDEGALLEPLGVAVHCVENLARVAPGETVAVFGAGAVGLLILQMAKLAGCAEAFVSDPVGHRLAFAKKHAGADFVTNPDKEDSLEFIREKTRGRGVDVAFEAAGAQRSFDNCLESARIGGRAAIVGIPDEPRLSFNPHSMRRKELLVWNVRRSNRTLERCVGLAAEKKIDLSPYVTHKFGLDKMDDALRLGGDYSDGVIRVVANP